jgi:AraC-like DNA-binding protein
MIQPRKWDIFDLNLSLIDTMRFTQTHVPIDMPSFLDMHPDGQHYRYRLLIANLNEHYKSNRIPANAHTHPVFHIVLYVAGKGYVNIADQLHPVANGTLAVISPNVPHSFAPAGGDVTYHALTFALCAGETYLGIDVNHLLTHYLGKPIDLPPLTNLHENTFSVLRHRIESIVEHLQKQPVNWCHHQQQMIALLGQLGDIGSSVVASPGLVQQAQHIIENRYTDPNLTLQTLADELHTSPEHLCRQYRDVNGRSPIQYKNHLRTQAATALLRSTNVPGKVIAERLGYADVHTFSKAYRRATGHAPMQIRSATNLHG